MKTSEFLAEARHNIEMYGWIQGDFGAPDEGLCVMGAINWVTTAHYAVSANLVGELRTLNSGRKEACVYLRQAVGLPAYPQKGIGACPASGIAAWNDDPHRTKGEVLDAFIHAEKLAREDEEAE